MDIRPQDLPELRAELLNFYQHPETIKWWGNQSRQPALTIHDTSGALVAALNPSGDERRRDEIDRLSTADLYFVSSQMTDLAIAAAPSLPPFDLADHDLPSASGLILFGKPIAIDTNVEDGAQMPIIGASWNLRSARGKPVLWFRGPPPEWWTR